MDLIGKTPINPFVFYSGKLSGYFCWLLFIVSAFDIYTIGGYPPRIIQNIAFVFGVLSFLLTVLSIFKLGNSIRLGLPREDTFLKTGGIYRFSRNPMYLGFNLLTLAGMMISWNLFIAMIGLFSIVVYDFIIRAEERFLMKRFGEEYSRYTKQVRRYI